MTTSEALQNTWLKDAIDVEGVKTWYGNLAPGLHFPGFPEKVQQGLATFDLTDESILHLPKSPDAIAQKALQSAVATTKQMVKAADWSKAPEEKRFLWDDQWCEHGNMHFVETDDRWVLLVRLYCKTIGLTKAQTEWVIKTGRPAVLRHDCPHCGSTFLADSLIPPRRVPRNTWGENISLEWVAGLDQVEFGQENGFSWVAIAFQVALILATTFAGGEARARNIKNIPIIKPAHPMTLIIRIADSLPHDDFLKSIARGICVKMLERPAGIGERIDWRDQDALEALLNSQEAYYRYLLGLFEDLHRLTGVNLVGSLKWDIRVNRHLRLIQRIKHSQEPSLKQRILEMIANPELAVRVRNTA